MLLTHFGKVKCNCTQKSLDFSTFLFCYYDVISGLAWCSKSSEYMSVYQSIWFSQSPLYISSRVKKLLFMLLTHFDKVKCTQQSLDFSSFLFCVYDVISSWVLEKLRMCECLSKLQKVKNWFPFPKKIIKLQSQKNNFATVKVWQKLECFHWIKVEMPYRDEKLLLGSFKQKLIMQWLKDTFQTHYQMP